MCNNADAAEDLVQETFLAAMHSVDSFQGRSSHYTWLYGILRNKFRAWLREKGSPISLQEMGPGAQETVELVADGQPGAHEMAVHHETSRSVREALDELPAHHRNVLVLRYLERMSYREVADVLGCSLGTVKSRIHYALRRIGGKLKGHRDPAS